MGRNIGFIGGTGPLGKGLALRWGLAGEQILMGSRKQEKAEKIAAEVNNILKEDLTVPLTNQVCVNEADIILITTPFEYATSTLKSLLPAISHEKIIVDVTVPLKPFERGKMVDILLPSDFGAQSGTELIRKIIPKEIAVVGAFKTLSNSTLQDIDRIPQLDQDVYIFGKDKNAKSIVKEKAELIKNLRAVDAGGTLSARHIEHFTAFLIGLNRRYKTHDCGFTVTGLTQRDW
ncbi:MAG: NADPH-dependent F420 reductase [Candidatus Hodarchaeales archaeon]|jgi:NADPH-dependent F420 reductase